MNRSVGKITKLGLLLCLAAATSATALAQKDKPAKPSPKPRVEAPAPPEPPGVLYDNRETSEKAISVDPNVSLKLCVAEGGLKINGWERDEVRIFVRNGRDIAIKTLEKNADTGKPNWLWVTGVLPAGRYRTTGGSNCLAGSSVEIDVPTKSTISLEARTSGATVDSVRKLTVKVIEGDISIRNISGGISALTYQGDVMIENSAGAINLESTTGNIIASEVNPGQIGDLFKAKTTSGNVSLQKVSHRQIEANSISGTVLFNGKFLTGGIYSFKSTNGSIRMLLPQDTSCTLVASYGYGALNSNFSLEYKTVIDSPGGKNIVATIGEGEAATVNITTSSGSIGIRKQPK